jgi:alkylation response protein AidB-like acyl-CoA dehydrogenase
MPQFIPPLRDIQFVQHELLGVEPKLSTLAHHAEVGRDLIDQVVEEAGKFCSEVLAPTNLNGDHEGCQYAGNGVVTTPAGFKEAYEQFCAAGWPSLSCDVKYGGQGLPHVLQTAVQEMLNSANVAWTMYPGLTHGAYACLLHYGAPQLQELYLPRLVSGEWTGTMCLTEPHSGTDLGLLRSRAEPNADGSYRISGTKIFISAGEHDMAANIVQLVLARLPDAPEGVRGISLFVVPKFIPNADGSLGERNGYQCARIEEKMGIHGNSTCVLDFEGASGWLVGEPNKGLNAMFLMMNAARLGVGLQGLGLMEIAYQASVTYARERLQGRALTGPKNPEQSADPIIVHPDIRRMLLTQRAYLEASRAFLYWVALLIDEEEHTDDDEKRAECEDLTALLTPIAKAFVTDNAFLGANLALQIHGGSGYIQETGVEQYVRDARIAMIYEGTNGIQALDLIGRKILMDQGAKLRRFGALVTRLVEEEGTNDEMAEFINPLAELGGKIEKLTMEIGMKAFQNQDEAGAASVDYLRVIGHFVMSYFWARMARVALDKQDSGDPFYKAKLATARFYFARLYPETAGLIRTTRAGAKTLMDLDADLF